MQYSIDVVEDIPFGHAGAIFGLKSTECPIGDVFATVTTIFRISIVWETLGITRQVQVCYTIVDQAMKQLTTTYCTQANNNIFLFTRRSREDLRKLIDSLCKRAVKEKP